MAQQERIRLQCGSCKFDPGVRKMPWRRAGSPLQYSWTEEPGGLQTQLKRQHACMHPNMCMQISLRDPNCNYFGYVPRSGIAASHGTYIFNFWSNPWTVLHSGAFPYTSCPYPYKPFQSSVSLNRIIHVWPRMKVRWHIITQSLPFTLGFSLSVNVP